MHTDAFLDGVRRIVRNCPTYRQGGTGADGTCDCIGLIMGAMYACGQEPYDLHSSNYFARFQTEKLAKLRSEDQLEPGMIVYKARSSTDGLNARYQAQGRYFTGDLLDYYHAGVVTGVAPLVITHCTSGEGVDGIAEDDAIGGWTHCGWIKGIEAQQESAAYTAVVTAASGNTVNLRSRPHGPLVARIPLGTVVSVHEIRDGWAYVTAEGMKGCMMDVFLNGAEKDWIRVPRSTLLQVIEMLRACALQTTEEE